MHSRVIPFLALSLVLLFTLSSISKALVPAKNRFTFAVDPSGNGEYGVEYDATYTLSDISEGVFYLTFYNTTPGAFFLAVRMGFHDPRAIYYDNKFYVPRWVWEANRGKPFGETAKLSLLANGNLVVTEADGKIKWQTNTANKDVVGCKMLPNGNLVLYNSKGGYVWQSFDTATDTLLVGQGFKLGGVTKLVSRSSVSDTSDGPYSIEMEKGALVFYYTSPTSGKKYPYYSWGDRFTGELKSVTFDCVPWRQEDSDDQTIYAYGLYLNDTTDFGSSLLIRPKWNVTNSMLRLGMDGSLKVLSFYEPVERTKWELTYSLFSGNYGCQLPEKCGQFGLCRDDMCVGCPTETGSTEWSSDCQPMTVSAQACATKAFKFYKLVGVNHFMSAFTPGEDSTVTACKDKCSSDCKCAGYFYHMAESKCWVAYDLKTLTRNGNATHIGYIKVPSKSAGLKKSVK